MKTATKNRDVAKAFPHGNVCLLLDTSSIVRIRNFNEAIPLYAQLFELYTLEKNKKELNYLGETPGRSTWCFEYSMGLIQQLQAGNIKTLRNGAPYVSMPKSFEREIDKKFPQNNLSYTDKLMLFFTNFGGDNVALVTNDRELRNIAEALGLTTFGAFDLYLMVNQITERPQNLESMADAIDYAKNFIKKMTPSF